MRLIELCVVVEGGGREGWKGEGTGGGGEKRRKGEGGEGGGWSV